MVMTRMTYVGWISSRWSKKWTNAFDSDRLWVHGPKEGRSLNHLTSCATQNIMLAQNRTLSGSGRVQVTSGNFSSYSNSNQWRPAIQYNCTDTALFPKSRSAHIRHDRTLKAQTNLAQRTCSMSLHSNNLSGGLNRPSPPSISYCASSTLPGKFQLMTLEAWSRIPL